MSDDVKLDLRIDELRLELDGATREALNALILQAEALAKLGINAADAIDTGAMLNSTMGLVVGAPATTGETKVLPNADGDQVERRILDTPAMKDDEGAIVIAAEHGIWQELEHGFLTNAARDVAQQAGATISQVAKDRGLT